MAAYVHGNVVRKEDTVVQAPVRRPREVSQRAERSRASHVNKAYVAFLAVATMIAVFACMQYLHLQSEITSRSKHITSLQQDLADAKEANTTRYNTIMNSMNLEEIRDIAINEFGMVYAQPGQIIKYQRPDGSAVTQFSSIPDSGIIASSDEVE